MHYLSDMILELDDGAMVNYTKDGYMTAVPRVARTGIQLYRGSELGMPSKQVVKIYRDEKQVFDKDSLASFAGKPFTDNHPPKMVTSQNWKKYSAGDAGDEILRDGEFIRVPMMLRDAATIAKVKAGKVELSVGYGCEIDWTAGTTSDGQTYDGRQKDIRVNHIAVVDAARGGKKLAIGDADGQETNHPLYTADGNEFNPTVEDTQTMTLKTMVIDGITCEMSDTAMQVVQRFMDAEKGKFELFKKNSEEEAKKAKDALDAANGTVAKLTTEATTKDAQIVTLTTQVADAVLTPAKLDALVKDRQVVIDKAKAMLPAVIVDGKTLDEIMGQVVNDKLGAAATGWKADQIKISFDTLAAAVPAGAPGYGTTTATDVARVGRAFSQPLDAGSQVKKEAMYDKRDADLSKAWQTPAGAA